MSNKKTEGADGTASADAVSTSTAAADKPHYATRDFKDAGSERQFKKGAKLDNLTDGEIVNYAAAGLASTDRPTSAA